MSAANATLHIYMYAAYSMRIDKHLHTHTLRIFI